jgi:hypothetical protein
MGACMLQLAHMNLSSRPDVATVFTVSVCIELSDKERQLLGFMEVNVSELYDSIGKLHGRC